MKPNMTFEIPYWSSKPQKIDVDYVYVRKITASKATASRIQAA